MTHIQFASAYRGLQPAERSWVDSLVREIEAQAQREQRPLTTYLSGFDVPEHILQRDTKGMLLRRDVQHAVYERISDLARDFTDLTEYRWVKEVMTLAFSNIGAFYTTDEDGQPSLDFTKVTPEEWAMVKTVKIKESGTRSDDDMLFGRGQKREIEITFHDKVGPLKMLGEYMGMLKGENPMMRADRTTPAARTVTQNDTADTAGERYAALLEDGR